jgi:hypothetical protein
MHNALGLTEPVRRGFPSGDPSRIILPSCEIEVTDATPPSSWILTTETVVTADPPLVTGDWVSFTPLGTTEAVPCRYVHAWSNGTLSLMSPTGESLDAIPRSRVTFLRHRDEGEAHYEIMVLHSTPDMGDRERMIWSLAWHYHLRYGQDFWADHGVNIFTKFVALAQRWMPDRAARFRGVFTRPNPQAWRMACEAYVKSITAQ